MPHSLNKPLYNLGNLPSETRRPLLKGLRGNYQTVDLIKKIAHKRKSHPMIRKLAENIIKEYRTNSQDFMNEAYAIGDWVKLNLPYAKDPKGVESLKDPLTMIDQLQRGEMYGDCDDMSLLIATLLLSIGHQPYLCIVRYKGVKRGFQHIYVCTYEKNHHQKRERLVLDAIVKDRHTGWEVDHILKKEIKV